ncbi:hypothetical protein Sango_2982400 [Sesamum angolense]|uniref:DUF4283 domain-containing protein n=1 Tax=Sesamum angolense TaxID=2727404 RepID=A0AAE1T4B9_9LAMI|nr:hypothetical protein Sango_2982400 [Sesamum angolense]
MDEGEDGELVDGSHGAVSAAPATIPSAGGGAMMVDETEHGELDKEGHGAGPTVPTTPTTAEGDSTLEKLKAEFNIKEFLELASRVIDDGDSESMEMLKNLKNKWMKKLGGEFSLAGNGGFRPVHSRQPTPFPVPTTCPARHGFRRPAAEQAALFSEAPSSGSVKPQSPRAAHQLLVTATFEASPAASHWGPLAASACDASTAAPAAFAEVSVPVLNGQFHRQSPAVFVVQPARAFFPLPPLARVALPQQQAAPGPLPASPVRPQPSTAAISATTSVPTKQLHELFIGNVPLHPHSDFKIEDDKIAAAFHKSSRKTLNFIPPSCKTGRLLFALLLTLSERDPSVGILLLLDIFLVKNLTSITLMNLCVLFGQLCVMLRQRRMGFSFSNLKTVAAMEEVIEGGPWLYLGQPIVLQKWEPGMVLRKLKHTEVPVWIKLRHLPVELWTTEGLSTVASGIGRPLYPNAITRACTRLDFARVCVMLNVSSKLPKYVVIMMPNELGGESACKVDVEYEWLPPKCTGCSSLGHSTKECPLSKPTKLAVSIYVRKSMPIIPAESDLKLKEKVQAAPVPEEIHPEPEVDKVSEDMPGYDRDKGKDIVLFNAFDLLRETDDEADGSSRVLTNAAPQRFPHVEYSDMECSGTEQERPSSCSSRSC